MDINEIKQIIEADGGKFIFVENGKPTLVVCSFDEYKKQLFKAIKSDPFDTAQGRPANLPVELREDDLKIDDLPL